MIWTVTKNRLIVVITGEGNAFRRLPSSVNTAFGKVTHLITKGHKDSVAGIDKDGVESARLPASDFQLCPGRSLPLDPSQITSDRNALVDIINAALQRATTTDSRNAERPVTSSDQPLRDSNSTGQVEVGPVTTACDDKSVTNRFGMVAVSGIHKEGFTAKPCIPAAVGNDLPRGNISRSLPTSPDDNNLRPYTFAAPTHSSTPFEGGSQRRVSSSGSIGRRKRSSTEMLSSPSPIPMLNKADGRRSGEHNTSNHYASSHSSMSHRSSMNISSSSLASASSQGLSPASVSGDMTANMACMSVQPTGSSVASALSQGVGPAPAFGGLAVIQVNAERRRDREAHPQPPEHEQDEFAETIEYHKELNTGRVMLNVIDKVRKILADSEGVEPHEIDPIERVNHTFSTQVPLSALGPFGTHEIIGIFRSCFCEMMVVPKIIPSPYHMVHAVYHQLSRGSDLGNMIVFAAALRQDAYHWMRYISELEIELRQSDSNIVARKGCLASVYGFHRLRTIVMYPSIMCEVYKRVYLVDDGLRVSLNTKLDCFRKSKKDGYGPTRRVEYVGKQLLLTGMMSKQIQTMMSPKMRPVPEAVLLQHAAECIEADRTIVSFVKHPSVNAKQIPIMARDRSFALLLQWNAGEQAQPSKVTQEMMSINLQNKRVVLPLGTSLEMLAESPVMRGYGTQTTVVIIKAVGAPAQHRLKGLQLFCDSYFRINHASTRNPPPAVILILDALMYSASTDLVYGGSTFIDTFEHIMLICGPKGMRHKVILLILRARPLPLPRLGGQVSCPAEPVGDTLPFELYAHLVGRLSDPNNAVPDCPAFYFVDHANRELTRLLNNNLEGSYLVTVASSESSKSDQHSRQPGPSSLAVVTPRVLDHGHPRVLQTLSGNNGSGHSPDFSSPT